MAILFSENGKYSMAILVLFLVSVPIILHFLLPKLRKISKTRRPPGPRGLPLIGNLHQLNTSLPHHQALWQLSQTYGPLMSLRFGSVSTLVVSSAKMAKEVLKTHDLVFSSRPSFRGLQKLSYNGLDLAFSPYNSYRREMRKVCVLHLFGAKSVQSFRHIREDQVYKLTRQISKLSESSKVVNLSEMLTALTSTISCRVAFGKGHDLDLSKFHHLFKESQEVLSGFYVSDLFPVIGWVDILTAKTARLERTFKEFDLYYQNIIDEHLNSNENPKSTDSNIIDILLQLKKDKQCSFDVTSDHIKAILMNIVLAGTDTIAAAVVWAMTELMKNPAAMKKAQGEVRRLFGKKDKEMVMVDEDDTQKLHYLKAVVKETMRLHPPTPLLLPRENVQSCTIDGYEIPAKTLVHINVWAIGRDGESWENPQEFCPERFIGSEIDFKGSDFELIPFGGGRRGCPAINLGALTVELTLANLLCSFDWSLPDGMNIQDIDTEVLPGLTPQKKTPLCLVANHYN